MWSVLVVQFDDELGVGAIIAASVDAGLTVVYGENGIARFPTALPCRPDDEPIGFDPFARIVNRGAAHAAEVAIGAPMSGEPEEPVERLTFAAIAAMMRHPVYGTDGPLSSGGGGRRRTKPMKIVITEPVGQGVGARVATEVKIVGLTPGERDLYERHSGLALRVLKDLVGAIVRNEIGRAVPIRKQGPLPYAFSVYGLSEPEVRIIHSIPGSARRALIDHAAMAASEPHAPRRLVEEREAMRAQERQDRIARAPLHAEHVAPMALLAS